MSNTLKVSQRTKFSVTLVRAPWRENKSWPHDTNENATIRAHALCDLHNCDFRFNQVSAEHVVIEVLASDYYKPKNAR